MVIKDIQNIKDNFNYKSISKIYILDYCIKSKNICQKNLFNKDLILMIHINSENKK